MDIKQIVITSLVLSSFISLFLGIYSAKKLRSVGAVWYMLLMFSITFYSFGYAIELYSSTIKDIYYGIRIQYVGISTLPLFWFLMAYKYTKFGKQISQLGYIFLFFIPVITFILVNTNEFHHLYYKSIDIVPIGPFHLAVVNKAVWYFINLIFTNLMILAGNVLFFRMIFRTSGFHRKQALITFIAVILPWLGNVLYQLDIGQYHLDYAPFFLTATGPLFAISLFRFRMFDLVPIARSTIFERMNDPVIVLDHHNRIADLNDAAQKVFNCQLENTLGISVESMFKGFQTLLAQVREENKQKEMISIVLTGGTKFYDSQVISIHSKSGKKIGKILTFHDITVEKEALNKVMVHSQNQKELIHILCHDLANPFLAMNSFLELAKEDSSLFGQLSDMMQVSVNSGLEMIDLVRQMRTLEDKPNSLNIQREEIGQLINDSLIILEKRFKDKQIELVVDVEDDSYVMVEKTSFVNSVLNNVLTNAIKFSSTGDTIEIETKTLDKRTILTIRDHGIGMSSSLINNLFDYSKSTSRIGTDGEKGTGFGMPLVKKFIELYGGSLEINSIEKETGSTNHGTEVVINLKTI